VVSSRVLHLDDFGFVAGPTEHQSIPLGNEPVGKKYRKRNWIRVILSDGSLLDEAQTVGSDEDVLDFVGLFSRINLQDCQRGKSSDLSVLILD
jgi:hypothetical protein